MNAEADSPFSTEKALLTYVSDMESNNPDVVVGLSRFVYFIYYVGHRFPNYINNIDRAVVLGARLLLPPTTTLYSSSPTTALFGFCFDARSYIKTRNATNALPPEGSNTTPRKATYANTLL